MRIKKINYIITLIKWILYFSFKFFLTFFFNLNHNTTKRISDFVKNKNEGQNQIHHKNDLQILVIKVNPKIKINIKKLLFLP